MFKTHSSIISLLPERLTVGFTVDPLKGMDLSLLAARKVPLLIHLTMVCPGVHFLLFLIFEGFKDLTPGTNFSIRTCISDAQFSAFMGLQLHML